MANYYHNTLTLLGKQSDLVIFNEWFKKNFNTYIKRYENTYSSKVGDKELIYSIIATLIPLSRLMDSIPKKYLFVVFVLKSISFDDYMEKILVKKNNFVYFDLEMPLLNELFPRISPNQCPLFSFSVNSILRQILKITKSEIQN